MGARINFVEVGGGASLKRPLSNGEKSSKGPPHGEKRPSHGRKSPQKGENSK